MCWQAAPQDASPHRARLWGMSSSSGDVEHPSCQAQLLLAVPPGCAQPWNSPVPPGSGPELFSASGGAHPWEPPGTSQRRAPPTRSTAQERLGQKPLIIPFLSLFFSKNGHFPPPGSGCQRNNILPTCAFEVQRPRPAASQHPPRCQQRREGPRDTGLFSYLLQISC